MRLIGNDFGKYLIDWQKAAFTDLGQDIFGVKNLVWVVAKVKTVPADFNFKVFVGLILYFGD
jgi:hypothetical protein